MNVGSSPEAILQATPTIADAEARRCPQFSDDASLAFAPVENGSLQSSLPEPPCSFPSVITLHPGPLSLVSYLLVLAPQSPFL